ncbi:hypothetical protein [Sphingobium indicum]|uniref:Uncharacterized protein n=1 Tax=Sphingobium indicum (strain DSM 16412 / CCM 7286 / MTCC 6364 / B90A) TaxID=861109 RepID=A0A1L5BRH1_SPHIB|nr:hypothetical protein [Sphingobium indicum]APL95483.1 hypothetical protein SIDU_13720 [Sphingobium indicum B90A]
MRKTDILRYLAARFEFEPLPHYAMIAVALCGEAEALPAFARGSLSWLAWRFIEDDEGKPRGVFPSLTSNEDKASDQWRRAEDCALFLTDEAAALDQQRHRLWLVEEVEKRHAAGLTYEQIFNDLSLEGNEEQSEFALKRQWQSIVGQRSGFEDAIPITLMPDGEIVYRAVKART